MSEIILIVPLIDGKSYIKIQENEKISNPGQKFYELLYKGLIMNNAKVTVYSIINLTYKKYLNSNKDILYHFYDPDSYLSKLKVYKSISKEIGLRENSSNVIIADAEAYWTLKAAIRSRKLNKNKVIALITDFPHNVYSYSSKRDQIVFLDKLKEVYAKQKLRTFRKADGYILLTKQMKNVVAVNKPWIVVEGFSDISIYTHTSTAVSVKTSKNIVYLGALNGKSGILNLIKAFINIREEGVGLDIYGDGSYIDKIIEYSRLDKRINYHGVVTLEEIPKIEQEAYLLINPRPSNQEFNKYSFPSKTIEYMSSGTPTITTKLEGIPNEYNNFLYFVDDSDVDTLTEQLIEILNKDESELLEKGKRAQEFVLSVKNNKIQAYKILEFISNEILN